MRFSLRTLTTLVASAALISTAALADNHGDRSDWPSNISVGTASQGGTYYIYGSGWANLVGEMLGINTSSEVTQGPVQNAALVHTGDLDFGMVTMGPAFDAWNGDSDLAPGLQHDQLRAMFPMYETPFSFVALQRSGIGSVQDIIDSPGLRIGVGPRGGTPGTYFPRFLNDLGANVEVRYGGAGDQASQLQDGLLDVFAFAAGIPIAAFSEVEAQADVNIFGFTAEQIAVLTENHPVSPFTIPVQTYRTPEEDIQTVSMWNFAIANADMPESLVYGIVKTVMENNDRMMGIHRASEDTLPENYIHNKFLPFHPGAVRWFEENGYEIPDNLKG
jgi:TRAP transporter TAXI family solute receptor